MKIKTENKKKEMLNEMKNFNDLSVFDALLFYFMALTQNKQCQNSTMNASKKKCCN